MAARIRLETFATARAPASPSRRPITGALTTSTATKSGMNASRKPRIVAHALPACGMTTGLYHERAASSIPVPRAEANQGR